MGLFKKNNATPAANDFEVALSELNAKIASQFVGVSINSEFVSSQDIADAASRIIRAGASADVEELVVYAGSVGTSIRPGLLQLPVEERARIAFNTASKSMELRLWCVNNNLEKLNSDLTLVGLALISYLEQAPDFDSVLIELQRLGKEISQETDEFK